MFPNKNLQQQSKQNKQMVDLDMDMDLDITSVILPLAQLDLWDIIISEAIRCLV